MQVSAEASSEIGGLPSYRLSELVAYAVKLGTTGFGGPVALVAIAAVLGLVLYP
jgi:chromate transport protein ChrA